MALFTGASKAIVGYDVIHANISHAPSGQLAGYTTGSPDIQWTSGDWAAHPRSVRIDQDFQSSDKTADVLDVERGAATNAECAAWVKAAISNFGKAARPGQRWPAIYTSASNVTPVVNALISGGVKSGANLWVANWNLTEAEAFADVLNAAGPFPIVAVQYKSGAFYDTDIFSEAWLSHVSTNALHSHTTVAGQTISGVSSARNMTSVSWVTLQEKLNAANAEKLLDNATLKTGSTWYSIHP